MELKDNSQRAKWAKLCLLIFVGVSIIQALSCFAQYNTWNNTDLNADLFDVAQKNASLAGELLNSLFNLCSLVTIVVFITWFSRAYTNLHILTPETMQFSDKWAIISWIIPLLNLLRPYQIMTEIWFDTYRHIEDERRNKRVLVKFWWFLFVIGALYSFIAFIVTVDLTVTGIADMYLQTGINALIMIPSALLLVAIIHQLSKAKVLLKNSFSQSN